MIAFYNLKIKPVRCFFDHGWRIIPEARQKGKEI